MKPHPAAIRAACHPPRRPVRPHARPARRHAAPGKLLPAIAALCFSSCLPLHGQSFPGIDPQLGLGIWDFNLNPVAGQAADTLHGTVMSFVGTTAYSADAAGRSGLPGDRALNFGATAGNAARVTDTAFLGLLNLGNTQTDQLSIVFWQRWSTAVANSSTVWCRSASAAGNRGLQAHLPWSDNTIYFDSSGCCTIPTQRLSVATAAVLPGFNWQQWHHIALVKDRSAKQVWIDGQLIAEQTSGVSPLLGDWTEILLGQQLGATSNVFKGLLDDFAVFGTALQPSHIAALAAGTAPAALLVPPEQLPPQFSAVTPAAGTMFHPPAAGLSFQVTTVAPNSIAENDIRLFLNGSEVSGSLSIGGTPTNRSASFAGTLATNRFYSARAEAADGSGRLATLFWTFDTADPATTPAHPALDLPALGSASQSAAAPGQSAELALDGNPATVSATPDQAGSFWEYELQRTLRLSRISLVAPSGTTYQGVPNGLRLRVYNLRDQLVHEATVNGLAPGDTWATFLPPGTDARIIRIDLPPGQTNGAGDFRIALADLKLRGDPSPATGPLNLAAIATVTQSSTAGTATASLAVDGNSATWSETNDLPDSHWQLTLDRDRPLRRIELINRSDANSTRMGGLTVRVLDANSNTLATTAVTDPGAGATWGFDLPPGTPDARSVRIGLENGAVNQQGNRIVSLAAVNLFTGVNYALGTEAYMVRLVDTLPPPSNANDGNHATSTETTTQTVDGYWETDLGAVRSLDCVRVVALDSGDNQIRLRHATLRLFDGNHESIHSEHLAGNSAFFDIALPGPLNARYVRVGFENKERSSLTGGLEWHLRLREVQAYGRPATETGLTSFTASPAQIAAGQSATLQWSHEGLRELTLHPAVGSAGAATTAQGTGSLAVAPAASTEYILLGKRHGGTIARFATVLVDGQTLPPLVSEFVASNRLALRDGYRDAPDWIELHNPNDSPLDLAGHGLSDNPANPMKWLFPPNSVIPPHGFLVVFASGRETPVDPQGFLHASFNLNAEGESVVLTAPDGTTVLDSILNYPPQEEDLAYGRALDGTTAHLTPTPAALNVATAFDGWLLPPSFSRSRGFQANPFSLTIDNPNPGAELLYSLDGREPYLPYAGPIAVNGGLTVRANVRRDGFRSPRTVTHTFLFPDSVMSSPLMNATYTQGELAPRLRASLSQLPTICLSVPQLPDDWNEREASLEVFLPDGSPPLQLNAGLNRVGGSWTDFAKRSYRVSFRPEYGERKLETPLLRGFDRGMPVAGALDTLDLSAGNHDMSARGFYMANRFVEDTMLEMGSLNPHGRFVHVYVNGTYWGQYNAHERLEDSFLAGYLGGQTEDYVNVKGNDNSGSNFVLGTPEPPNREPWETARANRGSWLAVKDRVDLPQFIDFMLVWFYGNAESEFRCAGPILPGSGFKFWLADADGFLRTSALTLDTTGNAGPGGIFGALVSEGHPDFKALLADRIYRHFFHNGALTPQRNLARLDARMTEVRDSLIAECARWGYRTPANWESAAETIRTGLFPQRTGNLFAMLRSRGLYPALDPPQLSQHGGSVPQGYPLVIDAGSGTIYYTLDGSDPRLPGGGIAPGAVAATVTQNTHVALRSVWRYWDRGSRPAANWNSPAYADSAWSAGGAPLGYGSGDETTVVSYGPSSSNKYRTTYFRKTFQVANPAAVASLSLGLVRDDGAVVYLNGTEVARNNMGTGTPTYDTFASATVSGDAKYTVLNFSVPANLLVAGPNLLAVEVHQINATSSDLRFDLSLTDATLPNLVLDQNTRFKGRLLSGATWSALADATFHVAHPLAAAGPYVCSQWSAGSPAGSAPPNMRFLQTDVLDPPLEAAMDAPWTLGYDLTSRSRINGLGADGFSFLNTGSVQPVTGAGFVGAALLALDTRNAQDIRVSWTGGTVVPNERDYGIRLQYRVGNSGPFLDVPGPGGEPVEYLRNAAPGHGALVGPVILPPAAENKELVELRWKYYSRGGTTGARPQLRVDDIQVTAGPVVAESLALVANPATAQAGATAAPLGVEIRGRNGAIAENFAGTVTVSTAGTLGGTLNRSAVNGRVAFDDLVFPQPGLFHLTVSSPGLAPATTAFPTRVAGLTELVLPGQIQGAQPDNDQRVPYACLLRLDGLLANATYRHAPQIVYPDDTPETEGAGNMIFTDTPGGSFVRTTASPRFLPADLNTRHGEFTTGADGSHTGWFVLEPTSNIRFTPGTSVRVRVHLNDGNGGDVAVHSLTAPAPVEVLAFGTGTGQGSALRGDSGAAARNLLVFYRDAAGLTRPLAATPVEVTGAAIDASYAPFYRTSVAGQPGRWGTIVPNFLAGGVQRVEERDLLDGHLVAAFTAPEGLPGTKLLASGLAPAAVRIPAAGAGSFAVWQARLFTLDQIEDPTAGGPLGDPDSDLVPNLLEHAFGMNPFAAGREGLPVTSLETIDGTPCLVFRHRRLLDAPGLDYRAESSHDLLDWQNAAALWNEPPATAPNPDGLTETVTCRTPVLPGTPRLYLRLRVTAP